MRAPGIIRFKTFDTILSHRQPVHTHAEMRGNDHWLIYTVTLDDDMCHAGGMDLGTQLQLEVKVSLEADLPLTIATPGEIEIG